MACVPYRIRIGGYPACGKTTLCQLLAELLPESVHIQSEAWILPLEERKARDLSGAHPDAYDIGKSLRDLDALLAGSSVVIHTYDHGLGFHSDGTVVTVKQDSPLILDGTPFTLSEYDGYGSQSIFLAPADIDDWLERAIERDVRTRHFSQSEATRHNMRKARDLDLVWRRSPDSLWARTFFNMPYYYEVV